MSSSTIVAIVGRPNVGKSTLFNRLTEQRTAIVDDISGVTRDRLYGECTWNGRYFSVIDTGGYVESPGDIFETEIKKQVLIALDEADVIVFVLDVETGITSLDDQVAKLLRRTDKPVIIVVNKVDNSKRHESVYEFYNLGLGDPMPISSINGSGTGEMLDALVNNLPEAIQEEGQNEIPKFAIVGRPNVGKSSLINTLIGEDRNLVTDIAGTTRDSVDTQYNKYGFDFILTDTAGLRRKDRVHENLEFYSVMRAIRSIESSDVCILMIDAQNGMEAQDMNIFRLAQRNSKGIVIVVNKWDLVEKETNTIKGYTETIHERLAPFVDVPIIFISVLNKQRIHKVLQTAIDVHENRNRRIGTGPLNRMVQEAVEAYHPPAVRGAYIKIKYASQLPSHAPAFAFFTNFPKEIKEPYRRYLENQLRKKYNFTGVPLKLFFRKK
ncbi:MAG: ribosome biogenesis GTPase Der [Bacteroidales bacterium]|jgi:GTP-binding protein|nr:ribosome biogenesis GTPase Der [Bacteroidales bacterium]